MADRNDRKNVAPGANRIAFRRHSRRRRVVRSEHSVSANMERLEERLMLSTYHVAAASDPLEDGSAAHPFDSIQQAIDSAGDGDTVEVAPGTYTGDLRIAHRDLTLVSTGGAGSTCIQFVDDIGLQIAANNVHIGNADGGGFTFLGGAGTTTLIALADSTGHSAILASRFDTLGSASAAIDAGLDVANLEIAGNRFASQEGDVAIRGRDLLDGSIRQNRFTGPNGGPMGTAIELIGAGAGTDIVGNIIESYAIGLAIHTGEGVFATIQGNYFLDCGVGLYFGATGDGGGVYSAGVYGNYFLGNATGLVVEAGANVLASSIHVYQGNSFSLNTVAIENRNSLVLPVGPRVGDSILTVGTANWFGHRSGPKMPSNPRAHGDSVVGPMDFYGRSWLASPPPMVLPNVDAGFDGPGSLTAIPGDTVTIPLAFTNNNPFAATGQITLDLYVSDDATLDAGDAHFQTVTLTMSLSADQRLTRQVSLVIDGGYMPGLRHVLAVANADTINESAVAGDVVVDVVWQFGSVGSRRNAVLNLGGVRYSMSGGGTGTVSAAGTAGVVDIRLQNTTRSSSVKVTELSPAGGWDIRDIACDGPLGSFSAARTAVLGGMSFSGGLSALAVESVSGAAYHSLAIGSSKGLRSVTLSLGPVSDLFIGSELPVSSLTVANWIETAGRANAIDAPSIGTLYSTGDFQADIGSPGRDVALRRATVKRSSDAAGPGGLSGASWYLAGNVESIMLDKSYGCSIYVNVGAGVVGMPSAAGDFSGDGRIGKLTIGSMTDTRVAAGGLGSVRVRRGEAVANEVIGITTKSLRTFLYENNAGRISLTRLNWPGQSYQDGEFVVKIV